MPQFYELRFVAQAHVDVPDPTAGRSGQARIIGKAFDAETGAYALSAEPAALRIPHEHFVADKTFYRRCCQGGELRPADKATADLLGLPFAAPAHADQEIV